MKEFRTYTGVRKIATIAGVRISSLASVSVVALLAAANPAVAQEAAAPTHQSAFAPEEIIVTARKREESIMKAPVIIEAVSQSTIQNLHINSVDSLSSVEPSLKINFGFSLSGITVNMRGLGNGPAANYLDQDVALNLDGFTSNSGQLFRVGLFDMQQIEIMKGPQALFFGKSTSAGLIAVHSADPTKTWDSKVTAGYEFNADEMDLDGYVSGPITDELGIRIAGYHNTSKGYLTNPNPANPVHRFPGTQDDGARLTLKYDNPDNGLRVNFKGSITNDSGNFWVGNLNESTCATGVNPQPIASTYDPCKIGTVTHGDPPPLAYVPGLDYSNPFSANLNTAGPVPMFKDQSYNYAKSALGILNIDYDIRPGLTLTSVTALDWLVASDVGGSTVVGAPNGYQLGAVSKSQEFSEELRLTSGWKDSWINFMVGGLYNPSTRKDELAIDFRAAPFFTLWTDDKTSLKSETDSAFGQIILTPIDKWEIDAGVRYIHVNKHFASMYANNDYGPYFVGLLGLPAPVVGEGVQNVPQANKAISQNATLPEITLNYKPDDDLTIFASYKQGYKGPGFGTSLTATSYNAFTTSPTDPVPGEHVKGFEGGVKARLMNHQLALTVTGYRYNYTGLQVSFSESNTSQLIVSNGANARVQGFEVEGTYTPESLQGLTLKAYMNYNDAYYTSYPTAPCDLGQSIADGCIYASGTAGNPLGIQNLTGHTLNMAAKWLGYVSAGYTWDVTDKYVAGIDTRLDYSGAYLSSPELAPLSRQGSYVLLDAALRFGKSDNSWELGLLCRNCTNKIYIVNANSGSDGDVNAGLRSTVNIDIARPRQIMLQLTVHPNLL